MKRIKAEYLLHITSCILILFFSIDVYGKEPIAMVTNITGDASLISKQKESKCEILESLIEGDEIHLNEGASITLVYFNSSKEYKYTGKTAIKIDINSPSSTSGKEAVQKNLNLNGNTKLSPPQKDYGQAAIVFRGAKTKPKIKLIAPVNTKLLDANVEFKWEPLEKEIQYRFVLSDDSGKTLIETLVNGSKFKLPNEIDLNEGGYYTWHVEARLPSGSIFSNSSNFLIVNENEARRINRSKPNDNAPFSDKLVYALVLEQEGFKYEASKYWKMLSKEKPGNKELEARAN